MPSDFSQKSAEFPGLNLLAIFDIFQQPIKFYFNGRSKIYSSFGIICSIALYSFLFYSFIKSDLFAKHQPITISQSVQMTKTEQIKFSDKILEFGVVDFLANRYFDPTYVIIKVNYYLNFSYSVPLALTGCENEKIVSGMGENFTNVLCLENNSFILDGSVDDNKLSYLAIVVLPCDNRTSNNTCKSALEINNYVDSYPLTKYLALRYTDAKIDQNNFKNPFQLNSNVEFQHLDSQVQRVWNMYFKNAYVETDDGWFFPFLHTVTDIMLDTKEADFRLRKSDSDAFFKVILFASKNKYFLNRRYKKLPEVLAELAGIMQFVLIIGGFLARFVLYVRTLNQVVNQVYVFPSKTKKKQKNRKKNFSIKTDKKSIKNNIQIKKESSNKSQNIIKNDEKNKIFDINQKLEEISESKKVDKEEILVQSTVNKNIIDNLEKKGSIKYPGHITPKIINDDSIIIEEESIVIDPKNPKKNMIIENNNISIPLSPLSFRPPSEFNKTDILSNIKRIEESNKFPNKSLSEITLSKISHLRKKSLFLKFLENSKNVFQSVPDLFWGKKKKKNINNLNISLCDYMWFAWCKIFGSVSKKELSEFHQIIDQAERSYKKDMDSLNLVHKLHELEKLKILLLNEDQLVLFNFVSKPIISPSGEIIHDYNNIHESHKKVTQILKKQTNAVNFYQESYQKVFENAENSDINRKIIQLLDYRGVSSEYKK